jgi:hypothetical protein
MAKQFGLCLRELRRAEGLTTRQLANLADCIYCFIAGQNLANVPLALASYGKSCNCYTTTSVGLSFYFASTPMCPKRWRAAHLRRRNRTCGLRMSLPISDNNLSLALD